MFCTFEALDRLLLLNLTSFACSAGFGRKSHGLAVGITILVTVFPRIFVVSEERKPSQAWGGRKEAVRGARDWMSRKGSVRAESSFACDFDSIHVTEKNICSLS